MDTVIPAPAPVLLPIGGSAQRFPVRRVYCIGRNYAAHTVEMGGDPDREPPFFFQKNPDNLLPEGADFPYPPMTESVHHEIEMAVALGRGGADIGLDDALGHVFGYAVALDMTRRDLQDEMKDQRRPWEIAKAFEHSAPVGPIAPADRIGHPDKGRITLSVNGEPRQAGNLDQMIWKVPEMIAILSRYYTLAPGDVILTGTPAGVGAVARGDLLEGAVEGVGTLTVRVS